MKFFGIAAALAVVTTVGAIQTMDATDLESELDRERREWHYAVQHCLRTYGAQASPEYNDENRLICRTRRGEELPYRESK